MAFIDLETMPASDRYVDKVSVKKGEDGHVTVSTVYFVREGSSITTRPLNIYFSMITESPKRAWELLFTSANDNSAGTVTYTPPGLD